MTSFSHNNKGNLPSSPSTLDRVEQLKPSFNEGQNQATEPRNSRMVTQDRPYPVPRPSPSMAQEADRTSFNARWSAEADSAEKAAFKAKRQTQNPDRKHIQERTDPQTGGQVRIFNKCSR
ncbi:MAG: hypothetical protein HWE30_03585 [Methylocystaceae bacterium]|nr:hypothetical protein [Methylocystaceae bacterium]